MREKHNPLLDPIADRCEGCLGPADFVVGYGSTALTLCHSCGERLLYRLTEALS